MVPCWPVCQVWPGCVPTKELCLNGLVLPVAVGVRPVGAAGIGGACCKFVGDGLRANGFVPVAVGCMSCWDEKGGCWVAWAGEVVLKGDEDMAGGC